MDHSVHHHNLFETSVDGIAAPRVRTDQYYIRGILCGYLMLFIIQSAIFLFTFRDNLKHPTIPIYPEKYFHAAIYSLLGMIATGMIVTVLWSKGKRISFFLNFLHFFFS
jgi:hypothetical protein